LRPTNESAVALFLALALLQTASGCSAPSASRENAPGWVRGGKPPGISKTRFMYASSCAPTPDLADDKARAELSKQFSVTITQQFGTRQTYSQYTGAGPLESVQVKSNTRTATTARLEGVEIRERHHGEKTFCSLAVLDKHAALSLWLKQLDATDEQMARALDVAGSTEDLVLAAMKRARLASLAFRRNELSAQITVLGASPADSDSALSPQDAMTQYRDAVAALTVLIDTDGPYADRVAGKLAEGLSKCNIPTVRSGTAALVVKSHLELSTGISGEGEYVWVAYTYTAAALNPIGNRTVQTTTSSDELGHRDQENAEVQVLLVLENEVIPKFTGKMCRWWTETLAIPSP